MEVEPQQCRACGSSRGLNLLVREAGRPTVVYVQCAECKSLVAQYKLRSYYHHGNDLESFLRSAGPSAVESGRAMLDTFHEVRDQAVEGYERALAAWKTRPSGS